MNSPRPFDLFPYTASDGSPMVSLRQHELDVVWLSLDGEDDFDFRWTHPDIDRSTMLRFKMYVKLLRATRRA